MVTKKHYRILTGTRVPPSLWSMTKIQETVFRGEGEVKRNRPEQSSDLSCHNVNVITFTSDDWLKRFSN